MRSTSGSLTFDLEDQGDRTRGPGRSWSGSHTIDLGELGDRGKSLACKGLARTRAWLTRSRAGPGTRRSALTNRPGELKLRWRSVHGAHGYPVWMTDQDPAAGGAWQAIGYTTHVTHLVDDRESFKAYWS